MFLLFLLAVTCAAIAAGVVVTRRPMGGFRPAPHSSCVIEIDGED
jgi:hypothetical protein